MPETKPILDPAAEQVTVCMKAEYRRSCLYAVVGFILVAALSSFLQPGWPWGGVVLVVATVVSWLYIQTWRLRIDSKGLARRRLWVWSYWPWQEFTAGRVRAGESTLSFRCAARPWWDRWLFLEAVEPDEAATQLARLFRTLIPPQPAETDDAQAVAVPAEIVIGLGSSGRLQFTNQGIEYLGRRQSRRLGWDDVQVLRLICERVNRAVAHRLELQLAAGTPISGRVSSVRIDGQRIWAVSHRRAEWPRRLAALTPPRCWQVYHTEGDVQSRAEAGFRVAHWRRKLTMVRRLLVVLPPLFLALTGACFVPKLIACWNAQFLPPWWKEVALVCLALTMAAYPVMAWAFLQGATQVFARKLRDAEAQLLRFAPTDDASPVSAAVDPPASRTHPLSSD
jgi:hypothetical protein